MPKVYHHDPSVEQLTLFPLLKRCSRCKKMLPPTTQYFHADKTHKDGFRSRCSICTKAVKTPKVRKGREMIMLTCDTCGKEFIRIKSEHTYSMKTLGRKAIYCSRSCGRNGNKGLPDTLGEEYLAGATLIDLAEKYHVTFAAIRHHLQKMGVDRRSFKTARMKPYKKPTKPRKNHGPISEEAKRKQSIKAKQRFSDPAEREAARQRTLERMANGRVVRISKLEIHVGEELTRLGISFTPQYYLFEPKQKHFVACVDFMLDDGRAVEVNGTFWHADPRKYPDGPITTIQKKKVAIDERKRQIFADRGIPLIEIWEWDLTADFTGTIERALSL